MTRTNQAKTAYRAGLLDGYLDNPPDTKDRDWLETDRYNAGRSDGAAVAELDRSTRTRFGLNAILDLNPRERSVDIDVGDLNDIYDRLDRERGLL